MYKLLSRIPLVVPGRLDTFQRTLKEQEQRKRTNEIGSIKIKEKRILCHQKKIRGSPSVMTSIHQPVLLIIIIYVVFVLFVFVEVEIVSTRENNFLRTFFSWKTRKRFRRSMSNQSLGSERGV